MSFFFFFFNQNSSADGNESHDVNANVFKLRNRSDVLSLSLGIFPCTCKVTTSRKCAVRLCPTLGVGQ